MRWISNVTQSTLMPPAPAPHHDAPPSPNAPDPPASPSANPPAQPAPASQPSAAPHAQQCQAPLAKQDQAATKNSASQVSHPWHPPSTNQNPTQCIATPANALQRDGQKAAKEED